MYTAFLGFPAAFPGPLSSQGLLSSGVFRKGIHLGLDLKGGMHLILQVRVDEAISAETDTDVASILSDLQKNGITGAIVSKPDPKRADFIQVANVPGRSRQRCSLHPRIAAIAAASTSPPAWATAGPSP